jgi:ABC-type antimicrobial peptide transport system permease subunit
MTEVRDDEMPHVFVPYHLNATDMALVIRTSVPPAALQPALRKIAQDAGTGRAVFDVWPLSEYVSRSTADTRFTMTILSGFAAVSVLLAMIGLYGTLSYLSSQRSREFGVRVALGATRWRIVAIVAREGFALTLAGAVIGVVAALGITQILRGLLYGVEPVDAVTLGCVVVLIGALAMVACLKPAWSAGKADPLIALRYE